MYFDFKVPIPELKGKIYEKTLKGVTYINYEYDRVYKPEKQYNIPKRTTIGKKCDDDPAMMYPNPKYLTYFPDAELPAGIENTNRSSCMRVGNYMVLEKLIKEAKLDKAISGIYKDENKAGLFLDLAAYYLITENNAGQYYSDYTYNHPLFTPDYKINTDQAVSEFISQLSANDTEKFINKWKTIKKNNEDFNISYDSIDINNPAPKPFLADYGMQDGRGDALEGHKLIAYVAYILKDKMQEKLEDAKATLAGQSNFMNVEAAIRELEKLEMIRQPDGIYRLDRGASANQNTILKAFGIGTNQIKKVTHAITENLNRRVIKDNKL